MERILIGVLNIGLTAAILVAVGLVIVWILSWLGMAVPDNIKKIYLVIVAIVVLIQAVSLLFGLPVIGVVR